MEDREMTADEVIDMQAAKCVELAEKIQAHLMGQDLEVCLVVLTRLAVGAAYVNGISGEVMLSKFLHTLNDVYSHDREELIQKEGLQ